MHRFLRLILIPWICLIISCEQTTTNQNFLIPPQNPELNASVGRLFLTKNKLRPEVKTLPSGLQYSVIKEGSGPMPTATSMVTLLYQGRSIDGQVFDNQHTEKNPVTVRVATMIPGWQEAIQRMQAGSVWVLYIPSNLAFGAQGIPNLVGPNQTVIYTIHLLTVGA
jgi:FKBP-type peptidyl-prolyl cis-trans isomerase FklB